MAIHAASRCRSDFCQVFVHASELLLQSLRQSLLLDGVGVLFSDVCVVPYVASPRATTDHTFADIRSTLRMCMCLSTPEWLQPAQECDLSGFRVQFFSFSLLGCSKYDFFDLNCCTISRNISPKKNMFSAVSGDERGEAGGEGRREYPFEASFSCIFFLRICFLF